MFGLELYFGGSILSLLQYLLLRAALVEGADRFESIPAETGPTVVAVLSPFS